MSCQASERSRQKVKETFHPGGKISTLRVCQSPRLPEGNVVDRSRSLALGYYCHERLEMLCLFVRALLPWTI